MNADNLCDCCEERVGAVMCSQCSALLCEECDRTVHDNPKFRRHERAREENVLGFCAAHGTRAFVLCEDCKEVCCRRCMTEQHVGHLFVKGTAASERYTKKGNLVHALEAAKEAASQTAAGVQSSITALDEERQKALDAIEASFSQIAEFIEARRTALLEEVAAAAEAEEGRLQTLYNDLDTKCTWAEQLLNGAESDPDAPSSSSVVAASAEMEKCFEDLCSNVKKAISDSQDDVTKIDFVEECLPFPPPPPMQKAGAGGPAEARPSQLLSPFIRRMARVKESHSENSETATATPKGPGIVNFIDAFGDIKIERENQLKLNSKTLLLTMGKGEANPDGSKSATLSWDNAPAHVKDLLETENFFFVLKHRGSEDKEFREIYSGKELSRTVTCNRRDEFVVSGCIDGVSDRVEFWASNTACCVDDPGVWKKDSNYSLEKDGKKVVFSGSKRAIALGEKKLEEGAVYEWKFRVEKAIEVGGGELCLGVAPHDIGTRNLDPDACGGWFFGCYFANLRGENQRSGSKYVHGKPDGSYVKAGDEVGIVVDTVKGEISFVLEGENLGVAFKGIPLDKPLVPAVISCLNSNSVELISSL